MCLKKKKAITMNKNRLRKQLEIDEGVKYEVYLDHLGYATFGIGHLITKNDEEYGLKPGTAISEERVIEAFNEDVHIAHNECVALYGNKFMLWPDEVQEILVNMMFNLGRTRLGKFKNFRKALANKDWKQAAIEGRDSLWWRQVTNRAERLMVRLENV